MKLVDREELIKILPEVEKMEIEFPILFDQLCKLLSPNLLLKLRKFILDMDDIRIIDNMLKVFNSTGVSNSYRIANSHMVVDSNNVNDSYLVQSSRYVDNSKRILRSSVVEESEDIKESENISYSIDLNYCEFSSNCSHSRFLRHATSSCFVAFGENIKNCIYCYNVNDSENILLSKQLRNCKNKILCSNMADSDVPMILNTPVSEKIFNQVYAEISSIVSSVSDKCSEHTISSWFKQLNQYVIWDSIISALPFEVTFEHKLLITWITFCDNERLH